MAQTVPFVKPATIVANSGYFGPSVADLPIFGDQHPLPQTGLLARQARTLRNIGVFGVNLVGLSAGSAHDTADYIADVDRLEQLAGRDVTRLDDRRLLSLILLARDHAVDGWVLASGSFMLCAAFNSILRGVCGPVLCRWGDRSWSARDRWPRFTGWLPRRAATRRCPHPGATR
ncbi:conserved membrane domain protein [Mycobacterium xenopi 3993]|nr:conserved membrane domain protein [Mycobacterium xenopi 3993]